MTKIISVKSFFYIYHGTDRLTGWSLMPADDEGTEVAGVSEADAASAQRYCCARRSAGDRSTGTPSSGCRAPPAPVGPSRLGGRNGNILDAAPVNGYLSSSCWTDSSILLLHYITVH